MKIYVNDYIRTDKGYIWKIDKIDECKYCGQKVYICKETIGDLHFEHTYHKGDITKHSKNIIDLLEVGDIVHIVISLNGHCEKPVEAIWYIDRIVLINVKNRIETGEIKLISILTKEQFNQNSYKIGE